MTEKELYDKYNGEFHDEAEFFKDLGKYYELRLMTEARKFLEVIKDGRLEGAPL